MKKVLGIILVAVLSVALTACGGKKQQNILGKKIDTSLEKNKDGFYMQGSAEFSVDKDGKIVAVKFPYKRDAGAASEANAMDDFKEVTASDLKHVSGSTYYSKKNNQYYHIDMSQGDDGRILSASLYLGK